MQVTSDNKDIQPGTFHMNYSVQNLSVFILSFFIYILIGCSEQDLEAKLQSETKAKLGDPELLNIISTHSFGSLEPNGAAWVKLGEIGLSDLKDFYKLADLSPQELKSCPVLVFPETQLVCSINKSKLYIRATSEFKTKTNYQFALRLEIFKNQTANYLTWNQQVNPRDFKVHINPLIPAPNSSKDYWPIQAPQTIRKPEVFQLQGTIETSFITEMSKIKSQFSTSMDADTRIEWSGNEKGKMFQFTIHNIHFESKESKIQIQINSEGFDRNTDYVKKIPIPSSSRFTLIDHRWVESSNPHVLLSFSHLINTQQNIDGLIRMNNLKKIEKLGSQIKIFGPNPYQRRNNLKINQLLMNTNKVKLDQNLSINIQQVFKKPSIKILHKGNILPSRTVKPKLFIESIGLKEFNLKVYSVSASNITHHFQVNSLNGTSQMHRNGELIISKKVSIDQLSHEGDHYSYPIDSILLENKGELLIFKTSFHPNQINYTCKDSSFIQNFIPPAEDIEPSFWDYNNYGSWWDNNNNPCHPAYYSSQTKGTKNIVASDLSIIAKSADHKNITISVRDILSAKPLSGVIVKIKNYQGRVLEEKKTNQEGVVEFNQDKEIFLIEAQYQDDRNWLKLKNSLSLSVSNFDIKGSSVSDGIQVYQYGERGVWRPGDSLYLSSIVFDKENKLPSGIGVKMRLKNPQGNTIQEAVLRESLNGFYVWRVATSIQAVTGNYTWEAHLGGEVFKKTLKIAKVKPNRLKVKLDFKDKNGETLRNRIYNNTKVSIQSQYLHGASASGLQARLYMTTQSMSTNIPQSEGYHFDDLLRNHSMTKTQIAEGRLNSKGKFTHQVKINDISKSPGQVSVLFEAEVSENGGQSSRFEKRIIHPYDTYVGIKTPRGDAARGMLLTDQDQIIKVVAKKPDGSLTQLKEVDVSLYKLNWKWWWVKNEKNSTNYLSANGATLLTNSTIDLNKGTGDWKIRVNKPEWGRYLVRACDRIGKHCSSKIIFIDWPGWAGRAQESGNQGPQILAFASDKQTYNIGETVKIKVPSSDQGYFWVSLENGSRVLHQFWTPAKSGANEISLTIPPGSSPNAYISVVLVQPSQGKKNDLPLRLYGVIPIEIKDPVTLLEPIITHPESFKPLKKAHIEVSEKSGKSMSYTLAFVDEGILDLTNFTTPNPHHLFYKRQTLGVRTWDLYDQVMGAYEGNLDYLLSIGGGATNRAKQSAKRFKAMVRFAGPFHLKPGQKEKHSIELPSYVGSLRVMVVAADPRNKTFGSSDVAVPVRQDIMIQATLPRVLGPGEKVEVPLQIFNMGKKSEKVDWKIHTSDDFKSLADSWGQLTLEAQTDTIIMVPLQVANKIKKTKISFEAKSSSNISRDEIEIDIRTPVSFERNAENLVLAPGATHQFKGKISGYENHQHLSLTASINEPLNIEHRLKYLMGYPYGCVEQTTSKAFPQLYLNDLVDLVPDELDRIQTNISGAIKRLQTFRNSSGLLGYWAGQSKTHNWGSIYAAHFLVEAKKKGYLVDPVFYKSLIKALKLQARKWRSPVDNILHYSSHRIQAYRLYVLALANELPNSTLNRFYQNKNLKDDIKWFLAATYHLKGSVGISKKIVESLSATTLENVHFDTQTLGSNLRNQSMLLEMMTTMNLSEPAFILGGELIKTVSSKNWHSTQSTAWALKSIAQWKKSQGKQSEIKLTAKKLNGIKSRKFSTNKSILREKVELNNSRYQFSLTNTSESPVHIQLLKEFHPELGLEKIIQKGISLTERFTNLAGKKMNIKNTAQGDDIILEIEAKNPSSLKMSHLALTKILPTGWEFAGLESHDQVYREGDYSDIRDDRVYYFFHLQPNETRKFRIPIKASYAGQYYHSGAYIEHMYNLNIQARTSGSWVKVIHNP